MKELRMYCMFMFIACVCVDFILFAPLVVGAYFGLLSVFFIVAGIARRYSDEVFASIFITMCLICNVVGFTTLGWDLFYLVCTNILVSTIVWSVWFPIFMFSKGGQHEKA